MFNATQDEAVLGIENVYSFPQVQALEVQVHGTWILRADVRKLAVGRHVGDRSAEPFHVHRRDMRDRSQPAFDESQGCSRSHVIVV